MVKVRGSKAVVEFAGKRCVCTCRLRLCSLFALCPFSFSVLCFQVEGEPD